MGRRWVTVSIGRRLDAEQESVFADLAQVFEAPSPRVSAAYAELVLDVAERSVPQF
jgi:hypothetical protein